MQSGSAHLYLYKVNMKIYIRAVKHLSMILKWNNLWNKGFTMLVSTVESMFVWVIVDFLKNKVCIYK